jgi:hypothetical protein
MKRIILILILSASITGLFSQNFEVPKKFEARDPKDYAKYEKDIIQCVDWFMSAPINEQPVKRKDAYAFFMKWLTGTPGFTIEINTEIAPFSQPNPDLLFIFMGGWTKYALETKDYKNKLNGNLKGIESVIDFYQKNRDNLKKDENVERYIKMKEAGTLEDYIKKNL